MGLNREKAASTRPAVCPVALLLNVYTSSTPTHANDCEHPRMLPEANPYICQVFRTTANLYDDRALTLHGGGQGFESPRLHS
jgi:hypothetical protein